MLTLYWFIIGHTIASKRLGKQQAISNRFWVKDLRETLNIAGLKYTSRHIKRGTRQVYDEGTIVLIRRSKQYPTGHYLIRHNQHWMDPWINLPYNKDITKAQSGFRVRLPGSAMYALEPHQV